ncbi:MAG TPA: hypothetical protein VN643_09960 [Pyrinomonadaceae bacterium]|nr:hypothetical protein [Pyrinomonadaceae bacterium]
MQNQQTLNPDSKSVEVSPRVDDDLEEKCLELGLTLGLDEPVSVQVLEAALRDEVYSHNLLASRRNPVMLKYLLANPPKARATGGEPPQFSNVELVKRAASALLRWGKVGFTVVDQPTLERRRSACLSCPHMIDPPDKLLYKLTATDESQKICDLCGCSVRKKIRLTSESCPGRHPEQEGLSRWGEPWHSETATETA